MEDAERLRAAIEHALEIMTGRNGGDVPYARNVLLRAIGKPTDQQAWRERMKSATALSHPEGA